MMGMVAGEDSYLMCVNYLTLIQGDRYNSGRFLAEKHLLKALH